MLTGAPFDDWRERIEAALEQATGGLVLAEADSGSPLRCPARLTDAIRYALLGGGKRLRPILTLAACELVGEKPAIAMPAAVAVEMVHAYSLVHDDLPAMDDDDVRRGRPTCHKQFDEATAILAGDALLTEAFAQLGTIDDAATGMRCVRTLASAAGRFGMVGGQMADLIAETEAVAGVEELRSIHRRKTGALITASLVMGGLCGRAGKSELAALAKYGDAVGLLFQVTDDLLDAVGDAATMGKNAQKDSDRGKATYPGLLGVERSQELAGQLADDAAAAIGTFGSAGTPLIELARSLVARDR